MNWAVVVAFVAALAAPVGAYVVASRRMSGKIQTSDATDLWNEARSIREDYASRLQKSNDRTLELETRVAHLEGDNHDLVKENMRLTNKLEQMQRTIDELRETITAMQVTIDAQRTELEGKEP
jgi:septal ring factor EnvC (AmiA/AmiB activator)